MPSSSGSSSDAESSSPLVAVGSSRTAPRHPAAGIRRRTEGEEAPLDAAVAAIMGRAPPLQSDVLRAHLAELRRAQRCLLTTTVVTAAALEMQPAELVERVVGAGARKPAAHARSLGGAVLALLKRMSAADGPMSASLRQLQEARARWRAFCRGAGPWERRGAPQHGAAAAVTREHLVRAVERLRAKDAAAGGGDPPPVDLLALALVTEFGGVPFARWRTVDLARDVAFEQPPRAGGGAAAVITLRGKGEAIVLPLGPQLAADLRRVRRAAGEGEVCWLFTDTRSRCYGDAGAFAKQMRRWIRSALRGAKGFDPAFLAQITLPQVAAILRCSESGDGAAAAASSSS